MKQSAATVANVGAVGTGKASSTVNTVASLTQPSSLVDVKLYSTPGIALAISANTVPVPSTIL